MMTSSAASGGESSGNEASIFDLLEESREVVTTGSRQSKKIAEASSAVWVIDEATIAHSGALSVGDLLRQVPGLFIYNSTAGDTEISARAPFQAPVSSNLVLIDGRSINYNFLGNVDIHALPVDLSDIERIEIVMGPSSTLYGANAYNSVINIITKTATEGPLRIDAHGNIGAGWGGSGAPGTGLESGGALGQGAASLSRSFGPVALRLSLSGEYQPAFSQQQTGEHVSGVTDPQPMRRFSGNLDATATAGDWKLRGNASFVDKLGSFLSFNAAKEIIDDFAVGLQAQRDALFFKNDAVQINVWVRRYNFDYSLVSLFPAIPARFTETAEEVQAQYITPRVFRNQLIAGLQARIVQIDWNLLESAGRAQQFYGLFFQDEFRPIEPLIFTAGVRLETRESSAYRTLSRFIASPRVSAVYVANENHSFRLEFATAFRNPDAVESFANFSLYNGAVIFFKGNHAIKAEEQQMLSFGYQGKFAWFRPRVELFGQRQFGPLQTTDAVVLPIHYYNAADFWAWGGSAKLEFSPAQFLHGFVMYDYYLARHVIGNSILTRAPEHAAGLGVNVDVARFVGSLQAYVQTGTQQTGSFGPPSYELASRIIVNLYGGYGLGEHASWEVFINGTNLVDYRFFFGLRPDRLARDVPDGGAQRDGPRLMAGLKYHFAAGL